MDAGGEAVGLPPPKFTCSQPKSDLTGRIFKRDLGSVVDQGKIIVINSTMIS
jgi:hypothetical protein